MRRAILIFLLVFSMGCVFPTKEHVCPDGSIVDQEKQCPEYSGDRIDPANLGEISSINLTENKHYYVAAEGEVNASIILLYDESAWTGFNMHVGDSAKSHGSYYLELNQQYSEINLTKNGKNNYNFTMIAPDIPGEYYTYLTKRNQTTQTKLWKYNITIIGSVENETMAYGIANSFMDAAIPDGFGAGIAQPFPDRRNWNITKKEANETEDSWEVFIEAQYDRCGIDEGQGNCVRGNTVTGRYIIDKKTGQIVG
jgi:hypothetical protein